MGSAAPVCSGFGVKLCGENLEIMALIHPFGGFA
jgi:hypothetical protein